MHLYKSLTFYTIVIIVSIGIFSGCILKDLVPGTGFSLISWDVCDDRGFPSLSLVFSSTDTVTIKIFGPDNNILDSELLFYGENNTFLQLASYRESITPGRYILRVYDKNDNKISEKTFSFGRSELSVISCGQKWWKEEVWKDDYSLVGLTISIFNNGDTPVYLHTVEVSTNSKNLSGLILPDVILPGRGGNIDCFIYDKNISKDTAFNLSLKDSFGNIVGNGFFSVVIKDNVPAKEYRWRYEGQSHLLRVPYPEFLYSYYSSIDRAQLEDYSVYIFDVYDEDYIDLLINRLMCNSNTDDDVDKINFVASFVQNLEYKKDSKTNESFEYPRYPIETMFNGDGGGDCEDKAILTANILNRMGYNVALLRLTDHMAVGVNLDENISNYGYYTETYYFLETTSKNHKLGYIPEEYKSDLNLTVYPISSRPLLIHKWKNNSITIFKQTGLGDFVKATLFVENIGSATAKNIHVTAGFYTQNNQGYNIKTEIIPSLNPGMKEKVTLIVDIPSSITTWFKTRLILEGKIIDERESSSPFP